MKKISKNPSGLQVEFDEQWHSYTLIPQNKKLISGTKFIKKFFPPFEKEKIAGFVARKREISIQEVLKEWEDNRDQASEYGKNIHNYIENIINKKPNKRSKSLKEANTRKISREFLNFMEKDWDIFWCEKIVFNNKIAGTLDTLWQHKENKNHYILSDFKTNKEIIEDNRYNKYAYKPIKHLADNNYNHYVLQLSLYKYLLLSENYLPKDAKIDLLLIHLTPEKYITYDINYHQHEINLMMNSY